MLRGMQRTKCKNVIRNGEEGKLKIVSFIEDHTVQWSRAMTKNLNTINFNFSAATNIFLTYQILKYYDNIFYL